MFDISKLRLNRNKNLKLREKILKMTKIKREQHEITNLHDYLQEDLYEEKIPKICQKILSKIK